MQQGSRLQEDLAKVILQLQNERFFENLKAKYWNNSAKGVCPDDDESEGISLQSLGKLQIRNISIHNDLNKLLQCFRRSIYRYIVWVSTCYGYASLGNNLL